MIRAKPCATVVTRTPPHGDQTYLKISPAGAVSWMEDPQQASAFATMQEAARMAVRLPAELRAFAMPRAVETDAFATLH